MSEQNMDNTSAQYNVSLVRLNLASLVLITGLSGFCGGLAWAIIVSFLDMLGIISPTIFDSFIENIFTFPLIGMFFSAFFAFVGYPVYSWYCKRIEGQKLSGTFIS